MSQDSILHKIAQSVQLRLNERKSRVSEKSLRSLCETARTPHPFREVFLKPGVNIIAEVKFASPSQGPLARQSVLSPVAAAKSYLQGGAAALSVLTEQDHFDGKLEYLGQIRKAFPEARLLMKDFVIDEYQLLEGRVAGADAALLIVALLGRDRTKELLASCHSLGLTALVEVHDEEELDCALEVGADLIGVNNRNLKTLKISLDTSFRLAKRPHAGVRLISESGLSHGSELDLLRKAGYSGFLIGTSFMRTPDPGGALARILSEANSA